MAGPIGVTITTSLRLSTRATGQRCRKDDAISGCRTTCPTRRHCRRRRRRRRQGAHARIGFARARASPGRRGARLRAAAVGPSVCPYRSFETRALRWPSPTATESSLGRPCVTRISCSAPVQQNRAHGAPRCYDHSGKLFIIISFFFLFFYIYLYSPSFFLSSRYTIFPLFTMGTATVCRCQMFSNHVVPKSLVFVPSLTVLYHHVIVVVHALPVSFDFFFFAKPNLRRRPDNVVPLAGQTHFFPCSLPSELASRVHNCFNCFSDCSCGLVPRIDDVY